MCLPALIEINPRPHHKKPPPCIRPIPSPPHPHPPPPSPCIITIQPRTPRSATTTASSACSADDGHKRKTKRGIRVRGEASPKGLALRIEREEVPCEGEKRSPPPRSRGTSSSPRAPVAAAAAAAAGKVPSGLAPHKPAVSAIPQPAAAAPVCRNNTPRRKRGSSSSSSSASSSSSSTSSSSSSSFRALPARLDQLVHRFARLEKEVKDHIVGVGVGVQRKESEMRIKGEVKGLGEKVARLGREVEEGLRRERRVDDAKGADWKGMDREGGQREVRTRYYRRAQSSPRVAAGRW